MKTIIKKIALKVLNYSSVIAFLIIWETLSRLEVLNPSLFPPFTKVIDYLRSIQESHKFNWKYATIGA